MANNYTKTTRTMKPGEILSFAQGLAAPIEGYKIEGKAKVISIDTKKGTVHLANRSNTTQEITIFAWSSGRKKDEKPFINTLTPSTSPYKFKKPGKKIGTPSNRLKQILAARKARREKLKTLLATPS